MHTSTIAILGAGNMGASLLGGLIATGLKPEKIWIADPDAQKLSVLKKQFNIHVTENNQEAVEVADVVIFAIKPQVMAHVVQSLSRLIQTRKPLVISIAAGIREKNFQTWLGGNIAIVRCMPNTPALIRCGVTALFANEFVSAAQRELAESILSAVSTLVWLEDENQMDAVTALSGSGPAYFFLVIEALQHAGEKLGLSADMSKQLTLQTAYGAARMALEIDMPIEKLRQNVTSPGGTTEAALLILEKGNLRELFASAILAAKSRSEQLAETFSQEAAS
ncbi:MAG: pyrroline-5-carboxylate reductase [Gammaproteobacteria bacterium]